ncbi:hypothetical protein JL720_885 [Aureococcus anophagefferens]|nr:hypothetical protein JL720_885 [Aureococcus anophagefferens]
MLRRLKKFAVCSSVIVAGQASRVDDAPFAGQDESEDAKGLLRRLSECEDASYVQIFDRSLDYNEIDTIPTEIGELAALEGLRVPPAYLNKNKITGTFPLALCDVEYCSAKSGNDLVAPCGTKGCCDLEKGETCSSSGGGDACSGLAEKTCKKTAGCAYKKKTCSSSCSELSKGKCKKTDGCDYKKKQCSAASSCSGLSKKECKTTDGCDYKKKQCSAASSCSGLSKKECKTTDGCDYKKKQCSAASSCSGLSKKECKTTDGCKYEKKKDKCLAK